MLRGLHLLARMSGAKADRNLWFPRCVSLEPNPYLINLSLYTSTGLSWWPRNRWPAGDLPELPPVIVARTLRSQTCRKGCQSAPRSVMITRTPVSRPEWQGSAYAVSLANALRSGGLSLLARDCASIEVARAQSRNHQSMDASASWTKSSAHHKCTNQRAGRRRATRF